jgi:hypothetical protein
VPEFLRGCLAVCCLEQDFPIGFHSPIIPLEVLLSGTCLVGSSEVIRKLPGWESLPSAYGCVAVEDVNDVDALSSRLAAMAEDPEPAALVGARGRDFAREACSGIDFPARIERILEAACRREMPRSAARTTAAMREPSAETVRFPLMQIASAALAQAGGAPRTDSEAGREGRTELERAQEVLAGLERAIAAGRNDLRPAAQAVRVEIAIGIAEEECKASTHASRPDPLFRVQLSRWAIGAGDLPKLIPVRDPALRVLNFDYDLRDFRNVRSVADFPVVASPGSSSIVIFGDYNDAPREPLLIDRATARVLELSDGKRCVGEILKKIGKGDDGLPWVERLLVCGLLHLQSRDGEA